MKFKYVRIEGREIAENTMHAKGVFSICMQMLRDDVMDEEEIVEDVNWFMAYHAQIFK